LPNGLRLVRAMDAIKRRAEIEGAGAERIVDAAGHVAGQIGATPAHLGRRGPAGPFPLGADAMYAAPAETVTADADAIAQGLAARLDQVEPPLGRVDDDGARRVIGRIGDCGALDRARTGVIVRAATHDVTGIAKEALRPCLSGAGQKHGGSDQT